MISNRGNLSIATNTAENQPLAKVMIPSKFRNQFYLVATSSPWKYVLSTGEYVFDFTINVLMIFLRITCENCPIPSFVVWQAK